MTNCENKLYDSNGFDYTDKLNNLKLKEIDLSKIEIKSDIILMELAVISSMFDKLKILDENGNIIMLYDEKQVKKIQDYINDLIEKADKYKIIFNIDLWQTIYSMIVVLNLLKKYKIIYYD